MESAHMGACQQALHQLVLGKGTLAENHGVLKSS